MPRKISQFPKDTFFFFFNFFKFNVRFFIQCMERGKDLQQWFSTFFGGPGPHVYFKWTLKTRTPPQSQIEEEKLVKNSRNCILTSFSSSFFCVYHLRQLLVALFQFRAGDLKRLFLFVFFLREIL